MAIVIPYVKQVWADLDPTKPASATRFGVLEEGVLDVSQAPAVRAFHNAAQAITTGTNAVVALNSERYDQAGGSASTMHDNVTNNSRLTALYGGIYSIKANIEWAGNATGTRWLYIRLNGAGFIAQTQSLPQNGAAAVQMALATDWSMSVNDYVEIVVVQTSGGNLNINATASYSPEFMMARVG